MLILHAVGSKQTPAIQKILCCIWDTYVFVNGILIFEKVETHKQSTVN